MLQEIYISNFILIDELRIDFHAGLNVLTGETGAGKSIIIDALGLILGERSNAEFVKNPGNKAIVEAVFDLKGNTSAINYLNELELLDEESMAAIIRREITATGKSSQRINNRSVNLTIIRDLAPMLVDIHLQHDSLKFLIPERQLKIIDGMLNEESELLPKLRVLFKEFKQNEKEITAHLDKEKNREDEISLLNYQIEEIKSVHLKPGEEEELLNVKERIHSSKKLTECAASIEQLVYQGDKFPSALDQIGKALSIADTVKNDEFYFSFQKSLSSIYYELQDITQGLLSFRDGLDFLPEELDSIEERLHKITKLKKRYGETVDEVLNYLAKAEFEREELLNNKRYIDDLLLLRVKYQDELNSNAQQLTEARKKAASFLEKRVLAELSELNLPNLKLEVVVKTSAQINENGNDQVEFLFSANLGEGLRPIAQIASGGEVSRFVLALKTALAQNYQVPTLVFDEIDMGVGGTSLAIMAQKIQQIARSHQIILVTHAPQVACYANNHHLIEKITVDSNTEIVVKSLNKEERAHEIARMLSGENYSPLTLKHAWEMLDQNTLEFND